MTAATQILKISNQPSEMLKVIADSMDHCVKDHLNGFGIDRI